MSDDMLLIMNGMIILLTRRTIRIWMIILLLTRRRYQEPSKYSTEECSSKRSILGHGSWAQMHRSTQGT